jgi:mevalonate kinase
VCVNKVKSLEAKDSQQFLKIDEQMKKATLLCKSALIENSEKSFDVLKTALDLGSDCFSQWGLITPALKYHMQELKASGAKAMKPTGSGGGGFVLSLWDHEVSDEKFLKASVL